ncbi:MAG: phospho-N-acetylmuramoyl-pentapeptide-transferase, partial [Sphingobacteriales bacterium]
MLYHLFEWLNQEGIRLPGGGLFQFITFRAMMAILLSLVITLIFGKRIINFLKSKQIGEGVRDLGLEGEQLKKGTPTMGGIIILMGILIPTILFANLNKVYVWLILLSTIWLGLVGFLDDYFKLQAKRRSKDSNYKKSDSDGLAGWSKVMGQVGLGLIIGLTLYFSPDT